MSVDLWELFNKKFEKLIEEEKWKTFKYLKDDDSFSDDLTKIPNDKGGIYTYYIESPILGDRQRILFYVGRALITDDENIRSRIYDYKKYFVPNPAEGLRKKLRGVIKKWKKYVYCKYLTLDDNDTIIELEANLIDCLCPYCNTVIHSKIKAGCEQAWPK